MQRAVSGEEEGNTPASSMGLGLMALSFAVTLMTAPYFGLHSDVTLRSLSMQLFNATGCIFTSVMLFKGVTSVLKDWLDAVSRLLLAALLTTLANAVVWACSRLNGVTTQGVARDALAMKTFGSTAMYLAALAWVPLWTDVGDWLADGGAGWSICWVCPVATGIFLLGTLATGCAQWPAGDRSGHGFAEEADAVTTAPAHLARQCEEQGAALLASILAMQQTRDAIKRFVSFAVDEEAAIVRYSLWQISIVMLAGAAAMALPTVLLKYNGSTIRHPSASLVHSCLMKACSVLVKSCMFFSGWAALISMQWFLISYIIHNLVDKIILYIVVALLSSYFAFGILLCVSRFGPDSDPSGVEITDTVTQTLGIMVGFSWERCASLVNSQLAAVGSSALFGADCGFEGSVMFAICLVVCALTFLGLLLAIVPRELDARRKVNSKEMDGSERPLLQDSPSQTDSGTGGTQLPLGAGPTAKPIARAELAAERDQVTESSPAPPTSQPPESLATTLPFQLAVSSQRAGAMSIPPGTSSKVSSQRVSSPPGDKSNKMRKALLAPERMHAILDQQPPGVHSGVPSPPENASAIALYSPSVRDQGVDATPPSSMDPFALPALPALPGPLPGTQLYPKLGSNKLGAVPASGSRSSSSGPDSSATYVQDWLAGAGGGLQATHASALQETGSRRPEKVRKNKIR